MRDRTHGCVMTEPCVPCCPLRCVTSTVFYLQPRQGARRPRRGRSMHARGAPRGAAALRCCATAFTGGLCTGHGHVRRARRRTSPRGGAARRGEARQGRPAMRRGCVLIYPLFFEWRPLYYALVLTHQKPDISYPSTSPRVAAPLCLLALCCPRYVACRPATLPAAESPQRPWRRVRNASVETPPPKLWRCSARMLPLVDFSRTLKRPLGHAPPSPALPADGHAFTKQPQTPSTPGRKKRYSIAQRSTPT